MIGLKFCEFCFSRKIIVTLEPLEAGTDAIPSIILQALCPPLDMSIGFIQFLVESQTKTFAEREWLMVRLLYQLTDITCIKIKTKSQSHVDTNCQAQLILTTSDETPLPTITVTQMLFETFPLNTE